MAHSSKKNPRQGLSALFAAIVPSATNRRRPRSLRRTRRPSIYAALGRSRLFRQASAQPKKIPVVVAQFLG
jgi:hypothetical protein